MRIVSIGRAKSSFIRIDSEYVSAHHAELLLLDNGDIFLTDCGSRQGTFLFGKRIEPGVEVPVRRGDKIEFDDIPLNWAKVPLVSLPDPSTVKGIYGVGKSTRNRYQLSGDSVSRYHATFKEMKNGKWYIQDHSTNGTFINGQRIPADQDVRITSKDQIICGTVPCPNPVTSQPWSKILLYSLGGVAACVALFFGIMALLGIINRFDPAKATVYVDVKFALKVVFSDDPIKPITGKDWYLAMDEDGNYTLSIGIENAVIGHSSGTGFFISPKGHILTNRHVTDWVWADKKYSNGAKSQTIRNYVQAAKHDIANVLEYFLGSYDDDVMYGMLSRLRQSSFDLEVVPINFYIGYTGININSTSEMESASMVEESKDDRIDLALLQLNAKRIPKRERGIDAEYFDLDKAITDVGKLSRTATYYTVGFPGGMELSKVVESNEIRSTSGQLHLAQDPGEYNLVFRGDQSVGGQSGSPIYDSRNRIIGVLWGGYTVTESTAACPIKHAQVLFNKYLK